MTGLWSDVRHAARTLTRSRAYTAAVLLTLAIGVGANTAMFSVLRGVLLRPLPQENGDRIVRLYQPNADSETTGLSPLEIADYRAASAVADIVEYHSMPFTFLGAGDPQGLQTGVVSANWFHVMGVRPVVGRVFRPGEDQPGSEPVLVLSWEYWQSAFGGDPGVVGTTLRMNDRVHTIIGVLPQIPRYPSADDIYMPVSSCPFRSSPGWAENRTARQPAFALIREGRSTSAAVAELRELAARLHDAYPDAYPADRRMSIAAVPLAELMASDVRRTLLVLLAATASLLLLVCANVTNLTLARLLRRDAEIATRAALGASPARIARQIATEVVVLSLAGGALGIAAAFVTLRPLATWLQQYTPRATEVRLDATVLGAALLTAAVAGLVAGLLPAMARLRRGALLQGTAARVTAGTRQLRLRNSLIIAQVAIAIVLLTGSGLLFRSMLNLERVSPGFDPERVLTARVDLNWTRYDDAERSARFFRAVEERLAARPFVESVAFAASFPLDGDPAASLNVVVQTPRNEIGPETRVAINSVSPGYFDALGVPLLRGRGLTDADANPDAAIAAVVTRSAARRLWGDEDPIGRSVSADGGQTWGTVVGVVADIRHELAGEEEAILFVHRYRLHSTQTRLLVRGNAPLSQLETAVRAAVREVDAEQPVSEVGTIASFRDRSLAPRRVTTALIAVFAAIALCITVVGLAGLVSYTVAQRSSEIAIRAALGARPRALIGLVVASAVRLAVAGTLTGLALAALGSRSLAGLLFGVPPLDPVTLIGVVALLVPVVAAAALLPALRAIRIDPAAAVRRGS
jgi:putative ABC transport system permease protein